MRFRTVTRVRLEGTLPFTHDSSLREPTMLAVAAKGVNRSGLCYSRRPSRQSRGRSSTCTFGLFPKFSTPVEKTVEIAIHLEFRAFFGFAFYRDSERNEPLGSDSGARRSQGEPA